MKTTTPLDNKQKKLVTISAFTARGDLISLAKELNAGLDAGLTINQVQEELVQLYAYCGFPRSLQGINTFIQVLEERKSKRITDSPGREASPLNDSLTRYQRGERTVAVLTNKPVDAPKAGPQAFAPRIDTFLKEHLFADIFDNDILNYQEREIITIAALISMEGVEPMAQSHIGNGLNVGLTISQIEGIIELIADSVDKEQAKTGTALLKKVMGSREEQ
ncbi:carboxymuconolactone decarboxylase family protein [Flavobacterium rivuli]|nr:carboxymuconolactone decarboxylase family protein [Flavobacterium rivuli]